MNNTRTPGTRARSGPARPAGTPRAARTLVSVDFDFFVYLPQDERPIRLTGDAGQDIHGPAATVFDFGAGDGYAYTHMLWGVRQQAFASHGVHLEDVITLRRDEGTPSISEFTAALSGRVEGFSDPRVPIGAHDDHSEGLRFLYEHVGRVDQIISFDAHHDLGYSPSDAHRAEKHTYTVGSWLYGALREGLTDHVTVVYPDWRGLGEWETLSRKASEWERRAELIGTPAHWLSALRERITTTTWSRWATEHAAPCRAAGVFVCRSPGWTPPWCDPTFDGLLDRLTVGRPLSGARPTLRT